MFNKKVGVSLSDVQSLVDKKINEIKKEYSDTIKSNKEDLEISSGLLNFLIKTSGYKVYKLRAKTESIYSSFAIYGWGIDVSSKPEIDAENISVERLQTIGKYETFKVGDVTYIIAKKPKGKNK